MMAECKCQYDCDQLPEERRKRIFERYWGLQSWDSQTAFLAGQIKKVEQKRKTKNPKRVRTSERAYFLGGRRVCRNVFLATLGEKKGRVTRVLEKSSEGVVSPDRRGKHKPSNAFDEATHARVGELIDRFPRYKSHYSSSGKRYLHPDTKVSEVYRVYKEEEEGKGNRVMSEKLFSKRFKEELEKRNLSIYKPKVDTCQTCDRIKAVLTASQGAERTRQAEKERDEHQSRAEAAQQLLRSSASSLDDSTLLFTFDLQKTQPLPHLSTSVAFYKRQLWLYNLGIHEGGTGDAYMCLWPEGTARRGANEVGSAILSYLGTKDISKVKKIVSFSDGCGGQNRNKIILSLVASFCKEKDLLWEHNFLELSLIHI